MDLEALKQLVTQKAVKVGELQDELDKGVSTASLTSEQVTEKQQAITKVQTELSTLTEDLVSREAQIEKDVAKQLKIKTEGSDFKMEKGLLKKALQAVGVKQATETTTEGDLGFTRDDNGSIFIRREVIKADEHLNVEDLSQFVNEKRTIAGELEILRKTTPNQRLYTVAELEKNPKLSSATYKRDTKKLETYRGELAVSNEALKHLEGFDADREISNELDLVIKRTKNHIALTEWAKTTNVETITSIDDLKTVSNTAIPGYFEPFYLLTDEDFDAVTTLKDKVGRYYFDWNTQSLNGRKVFRLSNEGLTPEGADKGQSFFVSKSAVIIGVGNEVQVDEQVHEIYGKRKMAAVEAAAETIYPEAIFKINVELAPEVEGPEVP